MSLLSRLQIVSIALRSGLNGGHSETTNPFLAKKFRVMSALWGGACHVEIPSGQNGSGVNRLGM